MACQVRDTSPRTQSANCRVILEPNLSEVSQTLLCTKVHELAEVPDREFLLSLETHQKHFKSAKLFVYLRGCNLKMIFALNINVKSIRNALCKPWL